MTNKFFLPAALCVIATVVAARAQPRPNILVIMGDDIGYWNNGAYHQGVMGYPTPNIDRLAREGGQLMTYYAQQSCTAGRSAFINTAADDCRQDAGHVQRVPAAPEARQFHHRSRDGGPHEGSGWSDRQVGNHQSALVTWLEGM